MNPLVVTIVIALGTFILAIFGASWLNQQAMNKRIDDLRSYLDSRFAGLEGALRAEIKTVETRIATGLEATNQRIDRVEARLDRIERQLDEIFKPVLPGRG
ncbi:MAG TPA: hypothetical protein VNQ79_06805 [Blastocatellia bacterium]|nr:hypothetical protein [Blastocatellia bacterium]